MALRETLHKRSVLRNEGSAHGISSTKQASQYGISGHCSQHAALTGAAGEGFGPGRSAQHERENVARGPQPPHWRPSEGRLTGVVLVLRAVLPGRGKERGLPERDRKGALSTLLRAGGTAAHVIASSGTATVTATLSHYCAFRRGKHGQDFLFQRRRGANDEPDSARTDVAYRGRNAAFCNLDLCPTRETAYCTEDDAMRSARDRAHHVAMALSVCALAQRTAVIGK